MKTKNISQGPIIISKAIIDVLLKQKEPLGLLSLYAFYYYTAGWQKTNQPKATVTYTAKGLKIGINKVRRLKKVLIKLGMIEDIQERTDEGDFLSCYVKVNYYEGGLTDSRSASNRKVNAYSTNSKQCPIELDTDIANKSSKKSFDERCAKKLEYTIRSKRKIMRKVNKKQWLSHFREFRNKSGMKKQRIRKVLTWYCNHFGEEFVPVAYSMKTFCDKFLFIEDAMGRSIKKEGGDDFEVETRREGNIITDIIHYGD